MPLPPEHAALVSGLADQSTHAALQAALDSSASRPRLALALAVSHAAHASSSPAAHPPWRAAIAALRELAPALSTKDGDGSEGAASRVAVETHAALYALAVATDPGARRAEARDAQRVAADALRSVIPVQTAGTRLRHGRGRRQEPSLSAAPVGDSGEDDASLLDRVVFSGASAAGWHQLLPSAPADVASVVVPALIARVGGADAPLRERTAAARALLLPWLNFLAIAAKAGAAVGDAYRRRARRVLLSAADSRVEAPADALEARLTALAILPGAREDFAKTVLRAANCFLRSGPERDYDVVASMYERATAMFERDLGGSATSAAVTHGGEPVSAWVDHVLVSYCATGSDRLRRRAVALATSRRQLLRDSPHGCATALQLLLVEAGLYARDVDRWTGVREVLRRADGCVTGWLASRDRDRPDGSAELRILRVLEPVRAVICADKDVRRHHSAAVGLFERYVQVLIAGLGSPAGREPGRPEGACGVRHRLAAMTGAALAACESLLRVYALACQGSSARKVIEHCRVLVAALEADSAEWVNWLAVMLNNAGIDLYNRHVKRGGAKDAEMMRLAAALMEASATCLPEASFPGETPASSPPSTAVNSACQCPPVASAGAVRCAKRFAFASDAYLAAGAESHVDSLRAAVTGLHVCRLASTRPPREVHLSLARSAATVASHNMPAFRAVVLGHTADTPCRVQLLEAALLATQAYAVDTRRKQTTADLRRMRPAPRVRGLLLAQRALLAELAGAQSDSVRLAPDWEVAYLSARLGVVLGDTDGLSAAENLRKQFAAAERTGSAPLARGRRSRRVGASPEPTPSDEQTRRGLPFFRSLVNAWLAVEGLDSSMVLAALADVETRVRLQTRLGTDGGSPADCSKLKLYHALELAEWMAFVLALNDMDAAAVRAWSIVRTVCSAMGLPCTALDVADLYRRLGWTGRCWAALQTDGTTGAGECVGVHGRLLNDLSRFADAEAVVAGERDARCCGVGSDAAVLGHADVRRALHNAKAALKILLGGLSAACIPTDASSSTAEVFKVGGVPVPAAPAVAGEGPGFALAHCRARHGQLVELVHCLARLASLFNRVDSIADARYYAERARDLAGLLAAPGIHAACEQYVWSIPRPLGEAASGKEAAPSPRRCVVDAGAVNPLTIARLLIGRGDAYRGGGCPLPGSGLDVDGAALEAYDEAGTLLDRQGESDETDVDALSSLTASLLTRRGEMLLRAGDFASSCSAFRHASTTSLTSRESRLAALVGLAEAEFRGGRPLEARSTLETASRLVLVEGVAAPRLTRRMWRLLAGVELSLGSGALDSACAAECLARAHGSSLGLRLSLRPEAQGRGGETEDTVSLLASNVRAVHLASSPGIAGPQSVMTPGDVLVGLTLGMDESALMLWHVTAGGGGFALRLPIPLDGPASYAGVVQRLGDVLLAMKAMSVGDRVLSAKEKTSWWRRRFALDHQLGELMSEVEDEWFGESRALLLPARYVDDAVLADKPLVAAYGAAMLHFPELVAASDFEFALKNAGVECGESIEALLQRMREGAVPGRRPVRRGGQRSRQSSRQQSATAATAVGELLLAVDPSLERLPWECLPVLRAAKCGATRVPHEAFLAEAAAADPKIDASRVFYVLNPSGDLATTQRTFQTTFESQDGWTGVSGRSAGSDVSATMAKLEASDVFLYCGHGGGETVVPPRRLAQSVSKLPVSILMGCASGRLEQYTDGAESGGTALEYLLAGAPAVVANLWDVSDRDIDRLTSKLLAGWLGVVAGEEDEREDDTDCGRHRAGGYSLAVALSHARDACRLPFLVGAATVVYGRGHIQCAP